MRKPNFSALVAVTIVFTAFTLGFFLGRNQNRQEIILSVPEKVMTPPLPQTEPAVSPVEESAEISFPIFINQADKEEIMALPGIGEVLAERIIHYREENGPYSLPEDLLNVEGIGKKRLEELLDLISLGG